MDLGLIAAAGIATGTVLLFASIGEIFAERAGVLNLGVEGMMLMGAVAGYSTALSTGNAWLGVLVAMVVGALLALLHGVVAIHLRADQVVSGRVLAGLAGATLTLAVAPGWFGDQTVNGRGWIAVGLVIFARWNPIRAALGSYLFAAITPWILGLQGVDTILGIQNPFLPGRSATFFLEMLPFLFVILVVIVGARGAARQRLGAPAALGIPYVRGERGS